MEHSVSLLFALGQKDREKRVVYNKARGGTRPHAKVTHKWWGWSVISKVNLEAVSIVLTNLCGSVVRALRQQHQKVVGSIPRNTNTDEKMYNPN